MENKDCFHWRGLIEILNTIQRMSDNPFVSGVVSGGNRLHDIQVCEQARRGGRRSRFYIAWLKANLA
jgi:hypothetical protein